MVSKYKSKIGAWLETPKICMIEITNACNFSCTMCSNKLMKRKKGFMTKEVFIRTLENCKDSKIGFLKLYTTGESLLHSEFMMFWRLANNYPFKTIMISTNGSILNEDITIELSHSKKFKIQFSFSGYDKKSYESRYVGADFEEAVRKIRFLMEQIKKQGLPKNTLTINGIILDDKDLQKTKMFLITEFGLDSDQMYLHKANNWIEAVSNKDKKVNAKTKDGKQYYCHIANTRVGVLYDGRITACGCLDVNGEMIIGDVFDDKIKDIRKGVSYKKWLEKFNHGKSSSLMCAGCDSLKILK